MSKASHPAEYSIAAVSKLTGVSCHALRVWERRYGFPVPRRAPSGHRRYGSDQVAVLRRVARMLREGQPISELIAAARAGELAGEDEPEPKVDLYAPAASGLVNLLIDGDLAGAEATIRRLTEDADPAEMAAKLYEPALIDIGERWFRGDCDIAQERLCSGFLRYKLGTMIEEARQGNASPARAAVVGTLQGDRHEGGVLILGLLLELSGWRTLIVGVDLPVREYQRAIDHWHPDVLAVSFVMSRNVNKRFQELAGVHGAPIFVGGRSILNYQSLARRHGLIPIPGPATQAVGLLIAKFEQWKAERSAEAAGSP